MKAAKGTVKKAVPIVAGAIGAKFVKNLAGKISENPKIKAAIPLVLGAILISQKSPAMQGVGSGMIAVGGADLAASFIPSLNGIEDMDLSGVLNGTSDYINDEVNGVLNGYDDVSGYEEQY